VHIIIGLVPGVSEYRILEYPEMIKAFGDDLELVADWCDEMNEKGCPVEFTIAFQEVE